MLASRLLWSKGVGDLVDAGRLLRARGVPHRIVIVGTPDHGNSDAVSRRQLETWVSEGAAEWWGQREDMPTTLAEASIIALPSSYGEGLPKVLIKVPQSGVRCRHDIAGCRPIVREGENGLLVPVRDPVALAGALEILLRDAPLRALYGERGHAIAAEFRDHEVNRATLGVYADLMRAVPGREGGRSERSCAISRAAGGGGFTFGRRQYRARHRRLVLGVALLAALIVAVVTLVSRRTWSSASVFMPQARKMPASLSGLASQLGLALPGLEASQTPAFYADLLVSREVLEAAVDTTYRRNGDRGEDVTLARLLRARGGSDALKRDEAIGALPSAFASVEQSHGTRRAGRDPAGPDGCPRRSTCGCFSVWTSSTGSAASHRREGGATIHRAPARGSAA